MGLRMLPGTASLKKSFVLKPSKSVTLHKARSSMSPFAKWRYANLSVVFN